MRKRTAIYFKRSKREHEIRVKSIQVGRRKRVKAKNWFEGRFDEVGKPFRKG